MEDDLDAAEDERTTELSSIAAIFPELIVDPESPYCASLDIPVTPEKPLKIDFRVSSDGAPPALPTPPTSIETEDEASAPKISVAAAAVDIHELSHLPPLKLKITLPEKYPAEDPPKISLSAVCDWIPKATLEYLHSDCARLWQEIGQDQVIYTYIDHLQQAAERAFDLVDETKSRFYLTGDLKLALLDFDLKTKRDHFEKETFDCGICLEPKKGLHCHRLLLCGHVFCVLCLQDFYNSCISEGDVDGVKCLSPSCGKDETTALREKRRKHDRTLNPSELLQIPLEQEIVQRYVRLKRKKKLEADKNTVYCPRQWCQGTARSKKHPKPMDLLNDVELSESELESDKEADDKKKKKKDPNDIPMSERLCVCEDCNFAFCSVCKKGWHGELAICNPRRQAELTEEEKASLEYLQKYSTPCPTCSAPSQKTYGCNHMICFKCKTHFCYLCSSYLMPDNPYRHFNELKSPCYMRLWELEGGDGAEAGLEYAGGAVPWQPEEFDSDSDSNSDLEDEDGPDMLILDDGDDEDDSDDEEPAPDQRRPGRDREMHIEIVNFAVNGVNRRIELPAQPREAPPPVPNPPRRRNNAGRAPNVQVNGQRRAIQQPQRGGRPARIAPVGGGVGRGAPPPPVPLPPPAAPAAPVEVEARNLPPAAPGQGNDAQLPAGIRAMGLERFLELAQQDLEDEWDSDELDEDNELDEEPPIPPHRIVPRRVGRAPLWR